MIFTVSDDNEAKIKFNLESYKIVSDGISDRIKVFISTDKGELVYEIHSDDREPDIEKIRGFIDKAFSNPFTISEDCVRCYISIITDAEIRKFTAHKLL